MLVDEAHLLRMDTERFNYNKASKKVKHPEETLGFHGNQLYDILLRAKIVIAVFDPYRPCAGRSNGMKRRPSISYRVVRTRQMGI